ncbi:MAG: dephospho-CoA kinase [Thermodesulfobacteriota bacterium]|nr:dephospho-CoA kinase [Thermodesulfobacteriota bacterium]
MGKKIYKIGVTGSAGSGKSLVCRRFAKLGLVVVSCDEIARQVVEPGMSAYEELVFFFGQRVVLKGGGLDRMGLRKIISRDPELKKSLENIVQPAILRELFCQINMAEEKGAGVVAAEVPLLFELGLEKMFDLLITVASEKKKMVKRIVKRDLVSEKDAERLINMQMSQKEKIAGSDIVVWNSGSVDEFLLSVDKLLLKINKRKSG